MLFPIGIKKQVDKLKRYYFYINNRIRMNIKISYSLVLIRFPSNSTEQQQARNIILRCWLHQCLG